MERNSFIHIEVVKPTLAPNTFKDLKVGTVIRVNRWAAKRCLSTGFAIEVKAVVKSAPVLETKIEAPMETKTKNTKKKKRGKK